MADEHDQDRSEDPTQKRLDEAHQRGDVVKSQEVSTWFVIGGGALMLAAFSGPMSSGLTTTFRGFVANSIANSATSGRAKQSSAAAFRGACVCPRTAARAVPLALVVTAASPKEQSRRLRPTL